MGTQTVTLKREELPVGCGACGGTVDVYLPKALRTVQMYYRLGRGTFCISCGGQIGDEAVWAWVLQYRFGGVFKSPEEV